MKRVRPQKKRRTSLIILVVVLILALVGGGIYFWKSKKDAPPKSNIGISQTGGSINYNPPSVDEKNTSNQQKEDIIKEETKLPTKPPTDPNLSVDISRANQPGKGEALQIRTIVSGTDSGDCSILLTQAGRNTITKSVPVTPDATYVTCNTNIEASEFGAGGDWNLEITIKNKGGASPAVTQKVTISK